MTAPIYKTHGLCLLVTLLVPAFLVTVPAQAAKKPAAKPRIVKTALQTGGAFLDDEGKIVTYTYSPETIYRIYTAPGRHTHIELGPDEGLRETPVAGDTLQWRITGGPRNLYVKPVKDNISTTMTVITGKRSYQFQLVSDKRLSRSFQKVSFEYPQEERETKLIESMRLEAVKAERNRLEGQKLSPPAKPDALDFAFEVEGDAPFRPLHVYTDKVFTYLRLSGTQDIPAVFLVDEKDNVSLINYRVRDGVMVIERFAGKLLLKLGDKEVRITYRGSER